MIFTVVWLPHAEDELATLWLGVDRAARQAMTAATHRMDQMLRMNPLDVGEGREGIDRVVFQSPLAVLVEVHEGDRVVRVREVWRIA